MRDSLTMSRTTPLRSLLRIAALPTFAFALMAFFGYSAVLGPNGIKAWRGFAEQRQLREAELAELEQRRERLRNRVALADPAAIHPDLADELVRRKLKVARADEIIVPLDPVSAP